MRHGAIRIETEGSYWFLDEITQEYMRTPKFEAPRENPEWGNADAGVLEDAVWHPYVRWEYRPIIKRIPNVAMWIADTFNADDPDHWDEIDSGRWRLIIHSTDDPDGMCAIAPMPVGWSPPAT